MSGAGPSNSSQPPNDKLLDDETEDSEVVALRKEIAEELGKWDEGDFVKLQHAMAGRYYNKYLESGSVEDLVDTIKACQDCIPGLEASHEREEMQELLIRALLESSRTRDREEDLRAALDLARQLYEATAKDSPLLAARAYLYSMALGDVFHRNGDPSDFNLSITLAEEAAGASPQSIAILRLEKGSILQEEPGEGPKILNNLAARLEESSHLTGSFNDLKRSIEILEKLIAGVPKETCRKYRPDWLSNLAANLHRRYELSESRRKDDLLRAVNLSLEALEDSSETDPYRAVMLCGVAHPMGRLAEDTGNSDALAEAIAFLREAYNITPREHPRFIEIGFNLSLSIFKRSEISHSIDDLAEAIEIAELTFAATPEGHPTQPHLKNLLGLSYQSRFSTSHLDSDAWKAVEHFQAALDSPLYSPIYYRVQAGRKILHLCCQMGQWERAYEASVATVGLIPKMALRSLKNTDKQRILSEDDVVGFSSEAAAAALNAGHDGYAALGLLEMGRGSLAASIADLRTDLSALHRDHPDLAAAFIKLRDQLQSPGSRHTGTNREFDNLLDEIRQRPEFQGFLKPPSNNDILEVARNGPVVILSASEYQGVDAILVERDRLRVLRLGEVSMANLKDRYRDVDSLELLEWLWDKIARPVLDALGFTKPPPDGKLPRLWWIPTGILGAFPLHAAGHHTDFSKNTVMDRVMSSYSSSIKALLDARRRKYPVTQEGKNTALLVAMAQTPTYSPLRHAANEIKAVESLLQTASLRSTSLTEGAQKARVLQHMKTCQIFHFAGHGMEDDSNPTNSALLLQDWQTDPMTVGSILDVHLGQSNPFLAYLSACETGQITEEKFRDESIHLISAYQLAGFRHVIGTMWSVDDAACVTMARVTYQEMLKGNMTDEAVCRGLHTAARTLRDDAMRSRYGEGLEETEGTRKITVLDEDEHQTKQNLEECGRNWIPYVHFGA